jgi:xylanolytic transcriptional activator XlnR
MLDRHVALSFNIRPQLTDLQCQNIQLPCSDTIWACSIPIERNQHANGPTPRGVGYTVRSLDEFGLLVPLMRYYMKSSNLIIS